MNLKDVESSGQALQIQTNEFIKGALANAEKAAIEVGDKKLSAAVLDSVGAGEMIRESENVPEVIQALVEKMPPAVSFASGSRTFDTGALVLDAVSKGMALYEAEHGRPAPAWVVDDAIRSTVPFTNKAVAESMGLGGFIAHHKAVYDDIGSQSGGAMAVGQVLTAILTSFGEPAPFGSRIAMGSGLEGRINLIGMRAAEANGAYKAKESMDGLNAGKQFMSAQRYAQATFDTPKWTGVVKLKDGDTGGSPIVPSTVQILTNGFVVASANVNQERSDAVFTFSNRFSLDNDLTSYTAGVTVTPTTGAIEVEFTPALPAGYIVEVAASVDFEKKSMADSRPQIEVFASFKAVRATYFSGFHQMTHEARSQFSAEMQLDPNSHNLNSLRIQTIAERHMLAIERMWRIAQGSTFAFNMNQANHLYDRSIASIMKDLNQTLSAANLDMIARTNLNGIGVLYVGEIGASYFSTLPADMFQHSGVRPRAGTYRIGRLFGIYDIYYTPSPRLKAASQGFPILAIGMGDQPGASPYITGNALGAFISNLTTDTSGRSGQFFSEANVDTVNPFIKPASSACMVNVTF